MFLTANSVFDYLERKRFAAPADLVHGDYEVRLVQRRNCNLRVRAGQRGFLVKQCARWTADHRESLANEARCYWLAANDPAFASLQRLLPSCLGWDPEYSILILDLLPHKPLSERDDRFSPKWAAALGHTLALWHRSMAAAAADYDFPDDPPAWLQQPPDDSPDLPEGRRELLRALAGCPELQPALAAVRARWSPSTLIHGDLKLDNCLCDGKEIRLVDWEMCSYGDPLWDLASLAQDYWNHWVRQPDRCPFPQVQPALLAMIEASGTSARLETLVHYAGARMLQSAFETLGEHHALNSASIRILQAALNILRDPHAAARQFFGTPS